MCSLRQELRKGPREQDAERLPPGQLRGTQDGKVLNPNGINLYKPPIWGLFLPPIKMLMTWGCCFFFAFTTLLSVNVSYKCAAQCFQPEKYTSVGIMLGSSSQIGWKVEPVRNYRPGECIIIGTVRYSELDPILHVHVLYLWGLSIRHRALECPGVVQSENLPQWQMHPTLSLRYTIRHLTKKLQVERLETWKIWGNPHLYHSF